MTFRLVGAGTMQQHAVMKRTTARRHCDRRFATAIDLVVRHLHIESATNVPRLAVVVQFTAMAAWDNHIQPFSTVTSSRAIQQVTSDIGSIVK